MPRVPRRLTMLGSCASGVVALAFATGPVVAALSGEKELRHLVPYVLIFCFAFIVLIVGVVLCVALFGKDPMRLHLGEVTGTEYTDWTRLLRMGDNIRGE